MHSRQERWSPCPQRGRLPELQSPMLLRPTCRLSTLPSPSPCYLLHSRSHPQTSFFMVPTQATHNRCPLRSPQCPLEAAGSVWATSGAHRGSPWFLRVCAPTWDTQMGPKSENGPRAWSTREDDQEEGSRGPAPERAAVWGQACRSKKALISHPNCLWDFCYFIAHHIQIYHVPPSPIPQPQRRTIPQVLSHRHTHEAQCSGGSPGRHPVDIGRLVLASPGAALPTGGLAAAP